MRLWKALLTLLLVGCSHSPAMSGPQGRIEALLRSFSPDLPRGEKEREVVLFSYLPIDDPLQDHIPVYLNAIQRTTGPRIYNIALSDAMGPDNTFFHMLSDSDLVVPLSPSQKELTTNDPEILAAAVGWAYSRYPAKFKAFSFLGHGGGFMGIASDLTPGGEDASRAGTMMGLSEFGSSLKSGLKGRKVDVIHLHACLMANCEAAYELRGVARVLLASEDAIAATPTGTEKPTSMLNTLLQKGLDARTLAREYVICLNPKREPFGYSTASAIDLEAIETLKSAINGLAKSLIQALPHHRNAIQASYEEVPEFRDYPDSGQRDLWAFCNRLYQGVEDPQVRKEALAVKRALQGVLLHTRDSQGTAAQGLSLYMPRLGDAGTLGRLNGEGYLKTRFAKDTLWDEFLAQLQP